MELLFKHFWVLFVAVTFANGLIIKSRTKKYAQENPELEAGYHKFFMGWVIYANIPWLIMGAGMLSGMTSSIIEFFHPRGMNPMVLIFHASLVALWGRMAYWVFKQNGAEFIEKHHGIFQKSSINGVQNLSAKQAKFMALVFILAGVVALGVMWFVPIG